MTRHVVICVLPEQVQVLLDIDRRRIALDVAESDLVLRDLSGTALARHRLERRKQALDAVTLELATDPPGRPVGKRRGVVATTSWRGGL